MPKLRLVFYAILFLVPTCLMPVVTHRLIVEERSFGKETGIAYLRATAEMWARRAAGGESLPEGEIGLAPAVLVAVVDETGRKIGSRECFPADGRCFGESPVASVGPVKRFVRATWPGSVGRGMAHRQKLNMLEKVVAVVFVTLLVIGISAFGRELVRVRAAARRQVDYIAEISHRLKTPLTSISLCAELAKTGRLDAQRQEESKQTIIDEVTKLNEIVDEVLTHVKEMRRG